MTATTPVELDRAVAAVADRKERWLHVPPRERIDLLRRCLAGCGAVADALASAGCRAKGLDPNAAAGAEEWFSGPIPVIRNARLLVEALADVQRHGHPLVRVAAASPDGDLVARVFPRDRVDRLLYGGIAIDVWLRTPSLSFVEAPPAGRIVLVLGAGNVSSIGPMDVLYKLFVENRVVVLKMHPINDYVGPYIERMFAPLVDAGVLHVAYGDADVGRHLVQHPEIDEIHITGSTAVYERIAAATTKPITSELGCVTPVVIVPGSWSEAELQYQAEHVATMVALNASCNCNAAKLIVTWRGWAQRTALLDRVRSILTALPPRLAYYPGSIDKYRRFVGSTAASARDRLPFATLFDLDPEQRDALAFTEEAWSPIVAETALAADDESEFLERAVRFCNDAVFGTLSAVVLVDSRSRVRLGARFGRAIADLRYGTVAINAWSAVSYALAVAPWGAYPGHTREKIGSGLGVVHNTQMLEGVRKTVLDGPFVTRPTPPWFITHRRAREVARRMVRFEASPSWPLLPAIVWNAARA